MALMSRRADVPTAALILLAALRPLGAQGTVGRGGFCVLGLTGFPV
jgi:hypothetical protein